MTTKQLRSLQPGDTVVAIDDMALTTPATVASLKLVTVGKSTFPAFVMLDGGRFWTTGKNDTRIVTVA